MSGMAYAAAVLLALSFAAAGWIAGDPAVRVRLRAGRKRLRARGESWRRETAVRRMRVGGLTMGVGGRRRREARTKARRRQRCLDELPEFMDVIALGLSAGISFDAALEVYCSHYKTMLAEGMGDAMRSWRLGVSTRKQALRDYARGMEVGALTTFVETVTESLDFGAPLVRVLSEQADAVRRARRHAVEEQIEKAPIKMLVPTATLVLPAMLLAILGPILSSLSVVTT